MRLIVPALALLLAGCSTLGPRVPPSVAKPPAGYDHDSAGILRVVSPEKVTEMCTEAGSAEPSKALMCTIGGAFIVVPYPWLYPDDPYAVALWHELAHVMGWPADHPATPAKKPAP